MQTWFSNSKCIKTQQLGFALHIKISDEEGDSASKTKNKKTGSFLLTHKIHIILNKSTK